MFDGDNNRHVSSLFNVTTSWNRISITFPADTTGAYDDDNATSLSINFALHMGSDTTSGTLQTTWGALSATARYAGIDSFFSSTDNEFFLTGVQLEVGSVATPFEHRSFGEELALCQRYFELLNGGIAMGASDSATNTQASVQYKVSKRAGATIAKSGTVYANDGATQGTVSGVANSKDFTSGVLISFTTSSISNNEVIYIYANNEADGITADAEL